MSFLIWVKEVDDASDWIVEKDDRILMTLSVDIMSISLVFLQLVIAAVKNIRIEKEQPKFDRQKKQKFKLLLYLYVRHCHTCTAGKRRRDRNTKRIMSQNNTKLFFFLFFLFFTVKKKRCWTSSSSYLLRNMYSKVFISSLHIQRWNKIQTRQDVLYLLYILGVVA